MTQAWRFRTSGIVWPFLFLFAAVPAFFLLDEFTPARATDEFQPANDEINALFERAKPSVVKVHSGDKFISAGTGFFIDDRGTVLTSSNVIGDNTNARVVVNGVELDAKILGNDPRSGLAMLRVSYDESPSLPLGHSGDLRTGNNVVVVGYPMSFPVAFSEGQICGFDISFIVPPKNDGTGKGSVATVERFATTHIHANASISPGQVGSPLLNEQGEVIGIVATSPDSGQTIYALPVEAMQKIIADFNQYGRARHGWVGVNVVQGPDSNHDGRTVRVVQAVPGTPASKSGIRPGDTVMRIDEREIYRPADVLDASFFSHVGGSMTVVVRRDQDLFSYNFPVIERPSTPAPSVPGAPASSSAPLTSAPMDPDSPGDAEPILVNHIVSDSH
ncbi:MAG TPA: S1C family serine protease [Candidatus Methylacidiphilales bacterium]|nr:S1C family serine protease [Candidatus Methylacidiphilales bacterium]